WAVFFRLEAATGGQRSLEGLTLKQWGDAEQAGVDFALAYARPYFNSAGESEQEKIEHFVWWGNQYRRFISAGINQVEVARWATDPRESTSSPFVRMFSNCAISA